MKQQLTVADKEHLHSVRKAQIGDVDRATYNMCALAVLIDGVITVVINLFGGATREVWGVLLGILLLAIIGIVIWRMVTAGKVKKAFAQLERGGKRLVMASVSEKGACQEVECGKDDDGNDLAQKIYPLTLAERNTGNELLRLTVGDETFFDSLSLGDDVEVEMVAESAVLSVRFVAQGEKIYVL